MGKNKQYLTLSFHRRHVGDPQQSRESKWIFARLGIAKISVASS